MSEEIPPRRVAELAALSRAYKEAREEIERAMVQELRLEVLRDPDWVEDVGRRFGLTRHELLQYRPKKVLRIHRGHIQRAGLRPLDDVLEQVLRELREGVLKPGEQFPSRRDFTVRYECCKKVHAAVLVELVGRGLVFRRKERGGPMLVRCPHDFQTLAAYPAGPDGETETVDQCPLCGEVSIRADEEGNG